VRAHPHPPKRLLILLALTGALLAVIACGGAAAGASPAGAPVLTVTGAPQAPAPGPWEPAVAGARGGAPVTTTSLDPEPGASGWIGVTPVAMHIYISDTGTGYQNTRASTDGANWAYAMAPDQWFDLNGEGVITVQYQSQDLYGAWEPVQTRTVKVDATAPQPDALTSGRTRYRGKSRLKFVVSDVCPTVRVKVVTKTLRGRTVNTSKWYELSTNVTNTYKTWYPHPRGTYKWYVVARDPLGRQRSDWNYLVIY
jgi:hypothetical protein